MSFSTEVLELGCEARKSEARLTYSPCASRMTGIPESGWSPTLSSPPRSQMKDTACRSQDTAVIQGWGDSQDSRPSFYSLSQNEAQRGTSRGPPHQGTHCDRAQHPAASDHPPFWTPAVPSPGSDMHIVFSWPSKCLSPATLSHT